MIEERALTACCIGRASAGPKRHAGWSRGDLLAKISIRLREMSRQTVSHFVTRDVGE